MFNIDESKLAAAASATVKTPEDVTPIAVPALPDDPKWITHPEGAIAVYGGELIAKKDLVIMAEALHMPDFKGPDGMEHNCRVIIIRDDNFPRDIADEALMGAADPNFKAISLNLDEIFRVTMEETITKSKFCLVSMFHHQFHSVFLHELRHLALGHTRSGDVELMEQWDAEADDWAKEKLIHLAKTVDIEPVSYLESPWLAKTALAVLETLPESKEEFVKAQRHMLDNHILYTAMVGEGKDKKEQTIHSFKLLMQFMAGAAMDDAEWAVNTNGMGDAAQWVMENGGGMPMPMTTMGTMGVGMDEMEDDYGYEDVDPAFTPSNPAPVYATGGIDPAATAAAAGAGNGLFYGGGQPANPNPTPATGGYNPATVTTAPVDPSNMAQVGAIIQGVFAKCRDFMFTNCGQLVNQDLGFSNPDAVLHTAIPLTPEEAQYVTACDTLDAQGRICEGQPTAGFGIRGQVMHKAKMPAYRLTINVGGHIQKRLILPQNPARTSPSAQMARQGHRICWIYEGDRAVEQAMKQRGEKTLYFKSVDGGAWEAIG